MQRLCALLRPSWPEGNQLTGAAKAEARGQPIGFDAALPVQRSICATAPDGDVAPPQSGPEGNQLTSDGVLPVQNLFAAVPCGDARRTCACAPSRAGECACAPSPLRTVDEDKMKYDDVTLLLLTL